MELCQGTLYDVIYGNYQGAPLPSDLHVLNQIADGIEYIHNLDIIHQNINPQNILISKVSTLKLSDVAFYQIVNANGAISSMAGIKNPLNWMAPWLQDFDRETGKPKLKASKSSDIFSTGLLFSVFLTGGIHPFWDVENPSEKRHKINQTIRRNYSGRSIYN